MVNYTCLSFNQIFLIYFFFYNEIQINSRYHSKLIINILQVFFDHTGIGITTAGLHLVYAILDNAHY